MQPIVWHVIETLGRGGAEACLVAGLPALRDAGWDARVLALQGPYDLAAALQDVGVPVFLGTAGALKLAVQTGRPAIIHTHLYRANMLGRLASLLLRVPIVTTLHNPDYGAEGPGRLGMRRRIDAWTFPLASPYFIAVSDAVAEDYRAQLGYSATVVPNPIDAFWLSRQTVSRRDARADLGCSQERSLIFSAGRLHRQKGFDLLAEAAKLLPDVDFVVAGEGPERGALERMGSLRLLGAQPRQVIRSWIAAANLVAIPSRYESFGIFAAEAMACGRALVATDVPGLRATVDGAAMLVPTEESGTLAAAIEELLNDRDRLGSMESSSPALAARFTPSAWAMGVSKVYASAWPASARLPSTNLARSRKARENDAA